MDFQGKIRLNSEVVILTIDRIWTCETDLCSLSYELSYLTWMVLIMVLNCSHCYTKNLDIATKSRQMRLMQLQVRLQKPLKSLYCNHNCSCGSQFQTTLLISLNMWLQRLPAEGLLFLGLKIGWL